MKNFLSKKIVRILPFLVLFFFLVSCDTQNPLYGKWADSYGNTLILNNSKRFKMTVMENGLSTEKKGSYVIDLNTLIMQDETDPDSAPMLFEWDVQDSLLYLTYKMPSGSGTSVNHYLALFRYADQVEIE